MPFFGFGPQKGYPFSLSQSLNGPRVHEPSRHTAIQNSREYPPGGEGHNVSFDVPLDFFGTLKSIFVVYSSGWRAWERIEPWNPHSYCLLNKVYASPTTKNFRKPITKTMTTMEAVRKPKRRKAIMMNFDLNWRHENLIQIVFIR